MNLPYHFAVLTIGNCIRSATRLLGGRTCRSMHWRSHEVFGNKVVPGPRRIPQFLTKTSSDPQSSRHMRQLRPSVCLSRRSKVQVLPGPCAGPTQGQTGRGAEQASSRGEVASRSGGRAEADDKPKCKVTSLGRAEPDNPMYTNAGWQAAFEQAKG